MLQRHPTQVFVVWDLATVMKDVLLEARGAKTSDTKCMKNVVGEPVVPAQRIEDIDQASSAEECVMFLYDIKGSVI